MSCVQQQRNEQSANRTGSARNQDMHGRISPLLGPGIRLVADRGKGSVAGALGDVSWQEVALSADPPLGAVDAGTRGAGAAGILATLTTPPPEVIDLNGGYLHAALQPERALAAALARAGRRPGTWSRPRWRAWLSCGTGSPATSAGRATRSTARTS